MVLPVAILLSYPIHAAESLDLSQNYAKEITIPGYNPENGTLSTEKKTPVKSENDSPPPPPIDVVPPPKTETPASSSTGPQPATQEAIKDAGAMLAQNAKKLWGNFFISLSTCSPGLFVLPQINPNLAKAYSEIQTIEIKGIVDDKCKMSMIYYKSDDPRVLTDSEEMKSKPIGLNCEINAATIKAYIIQSYSYLENATRAPAADPTSSVFAQECQPIMGPLKK